MYIIIPKLLHFIETHDQLYHDSYPKIWGSWPQSPRIDTYDDM